MTAEQDTGPRERQRYQSGAEFNLRRNIRELLKKHVKRFEDVPDGNWVGINAKGEIVGFAPTTDEVYRSPDIELLVFIGTVSPSVEDDQEDISGSLPYPPRRSKFPIPRRIIKLSRTALHNDYLMI